MKKRILTIILALHMILAVLPVNILAATLSDNSTGLPDGKLNKAEVTHETGGEIPAFVPGIVPEEIEYIYPDYEKRPGGPNRVPVKELESQYDGRKYQTAVRNQGSNGLCWAFGAYAALESYMKKIKKVIRTFPSCTWAIQ